VTDARVAQISSRVLVRVVSPEARVARTTARSLAKIVGAEARTARISIRSLVTVPRPVSESTVTTTFSFMAVSAVPTSATINTTFFFNATADAILNATFGVLRAKVGGEWIPVYAAGPQGPQGQQGPQGPPGPTGGLPIGFIGMFGGTVAPADWLLCDGSAVPRGAYPLLFSVIGTTWGAGDGVNTFNVPDMRGRVGVGAGQGTGLTNRTLGTSVGTEGVSLTGANLPSHTHTIDHGHTASSGLQSANHSHTYSGNTGGQSADHVHTPSGWTYFVVQNLSGPNALDVNAGTGATTTNVNVTSGASVDHGHGFSGTTSGISVDHSHAVTVVNATASSGTGPGTAAATPVVQPSAVVAYIIRAQ
jgi:microcystin-dependent protein